MYICCSLCIIRVLVLHITHSDFPTRMVGMGNFTLYVSLQLREKEGPTCRGKSG